MLWHFLFFVAVIIIVISCIILQKNDLTFRYLFNCIFVDSCLIFMNVACSKYKCVYRNKTRGCFLLQGKQDSSDSLEVALGRWKQLEAAWSSHRTLLIVCVYFTIEFVLVIIRHLEIWRHFQKTSQFLLFYLFFVFMFGRFWTNRNGSIFCFYINVWFFSIFWRWWHSQLLINYT